MEAKNGSPELRRRTSFRDLWVPGLVLSTAAILLRILVASRRGGIEIDGITYLGNARALLQGGEGFNTLHPPLFSVLLALASELWSDPESGARVLSAILGGLWIWPTLWLARETTREKVAWRVGLLVALMPAAVDAGTRVLPEALFGLCLTAFLALMARTLRTGSLGLAGLTGILGGLATLARPEGMGYLFLSWGLVLLAPVLAGAAWNGRRAIPMVLTITVLWIAVVSPYLVAVRRQTGHWHWSGKLGITLLWAESVGDERSNAFVERVITETRQEDIPQSFLAYVAARPKEVLRRIGINLHLMDKYTLPGLLQSGGIALAILGLVHLRFRRGPEPPEWLLAAAVLPLGGLLFFVVEWRYFVAVLPVVSIIAGIGLARLGRHEGSGGAVQVALAPAALFGVVLFSFVPWIVRPWFRQDPAAIEKAAGLWLRQSAGPGAVFLGRYPVISHYAEGQGIPFARRPLDDVLSEGRKAGARFLIADTERLPATRPDLVALLAVDQPRPGLTLAHVVEDRAGRRVLIYWIR